MNFYRKSSGKNPEDFFSPYLTLADEATANVGPENEDRLQKAIEELIEYSGVKYITRPAIGNQSSVFVEITIPANRKSLYLINPYNEIIRHLV